MWMHRGWLAAALLTAGACVTTTSPGEEVWRSFSFEHDLDGWTPAGLDLLAGDTAGAAVRRSEERASDGVASVRFHLGEEDDAGKVWIERAESVMPGRTYRVRLSFDVAAADHDGAPPYTLIAGVLPASPASPADLGSVYRKPIEDGPPADTGYPWVTESYEATLTAGPDGKLHWIVGVRGSGGGERAYYIDAVTIAYEAL